MMGPRRPTIRSISTQTFSSTFLQQHRTVFRQTIPAFDVKGKSKADQSQRPTNARIDMSAGSTRSLTTVPNRIARLLDNALSRKSSSLSRSSEAPSPGTPPPSNDASASPLPPPPPRPSSSASQTAAGLGTTHLSPDIMLRCTIFDSSGSAKSTSGVFKKSSLCSEHGLEPRDLRKIDSRVPNLVPTILARRGGILVNILHIRAMIKKDKVLLFDSYGSTDSQLHSAFVYNLQHNLRPFQQLAGQTCNPHAQVGGLAYEFRALESILVSVLDALRIELDVVRNWTSSILHELDDDVDREKLRTLLQVSRKLNSFLSRAKAVKNAVVEVLENEEDMQLMYLSTPPPSFDNSSTYSNNTATIANSGKKDDIGVEDTLNPGGVIDELELLLESFDKQVEEVAAETSQLHSDINNTQEVVELILDNNRNKLLALDLKTSITTMGISAGTLWAGLFGMNLRTNMEEMDYAFSAMSGIAFLAVALTSGIGLRRLHRLRRGGLGQGQRVSKRQNKGLGRLTGWLGRDRKYVEEGRSRLGISHELGDQQQHQYYAAQSHPAQHPSLFGTQPGGGYPHQTTTNPASSPYPTQPTPYPHHPAPPLDASQASYQTTAYESPPASAADGNSLGNHAPSPPRPGPAPANASGMGLGDKWTTRKKKRTS